MLDYKIKTKFEKFDLSHVKPQNLSAIIPTVRKTTKLGTHAYYFLNFKTSKGICVRISHENIIFPGLKRFKEASYSRHKFLHTLRLLFQKYHYGFNILGQIAMMTSPHSVTDVGNGQFIINLWGYFGCLLVDCRKKTVIYKILNKDDDPHVLGSAQWHDAESDTLYYFTYSLKDSLNKVLNPFENVFTRVLKCENKTGVTKELWSGFFADHIHDVVVNKDRQYLVGCEMGRFLDKNNNLIPSKVLVLDLLNNKEWMTTIPLAVHAKFDPDNPQVVYFSNNNFKFLSTNFLNLLKEGTYVVKFLGPSSVLKYRLTSEGPKEIGVFSDAGLFRLTNFYVFRHQGRKIIAAQGVPNFIFIADAEDMKLIRKIEIKNPDGPCLVGTFAPSPDGQKLYVHTANSFQIVDLSSGQSDFVRKLSSNHQCFSHMIISNNTDW